MSARPTDAKPLTTDPLKVSPPLGAALALLGIDRSMPLLHGAQGCTAFALVLLVRHFHEPIPLQTTALGDLEVTLGGEENLEAAVRTIAERHRPAVIGVCPTALATTRGEDLAGALTRIRETHAELLSDTRLLHIPAPDYLGGLQEGWAATVTSLIDSVASPGSQRARRVNVLAGSQLTVADLDDLRTTVESFGLDCALIPDLASSLDGHMPTAWSPVSAGGTPQATLDTLGDAMATLAVGAQMRPAAELLEARTGVPSTVFNTLTGLDASDQLVAWLSRVSGQPAAQTVRRARSRLLDALADSHLEAAGARVAIAAEPDLLRALARLCHDLGCRIPLAVTTTRGRGRRTGPDDACPPALADLPCGHVLVGDLDDLEREGTAVGGVDLVIGPSPTLRAARALGAPLLRVGFPQTDRVGSQHQALAGYSGTRALACAIANTLHDHLTRDLLGPPDGPARPRVGSDAHDIGAAAD
ncbi:nitrogenase iron-molybdenum cofactor biosynthesis protein NifN [Rhodovibrio salinarum]|uniref:Nitrogenase iron-molybdenum cofactor biosynthesis protein NifN n=1 Tax=Rhodovibrio salinarum TaxID=1087 RepID=A0A934QM94_9PROT|nr:nitrogenase iron-molybdenum cofactor biosynthesis protein NifN [Rhodovibrio salinarum]MBK1698985.1 nitrogenase iron-molybdenum cofactor biosynthesis protein NifN [Rhodovibrio salinarum]